ncbi:MAG: hypothetical protein E7415_00285 [Ruminococcaceae bacterium]|nr:hypothetical protein [Oscillospiraceae bacterium]
MDKDKQLAKEQYKEFSFIEKIKYFWDYYKYRCIFILVIALLLGYTAYDKLTEVKYDLEIGVYVYDGVEEETPQNTQELFTKWLSKEFNDGKEHPVKVEYYRLPPESAAESEAGVAVATKFTTSLASGLVGGFILSEEMYEKNFTDDGYGILMDKEYSGEIGQNAKGMLGLDKEKTYYFVTIKAGTEQNNSQKAIERHNNAKKIYSRLTEAK